MIFANTEAQPISSEAVKVENDQSLWKSVTVATVKHVPTTPIYVVRGKVRYENVEGIAYLEMWNILPDGRRFFSRTLGEYGTMQSIRGTSGWRDFELPADLTGVPLPESMTLEINIVMPGKGSIKVSAMTISDISTGIAGEWFSSRTSGIVGGILGGGVCGTFGAVFGIVAGLLVPRGKGRRWVMGLLLFGLVMGAVQLVFGLVVLCIGQPWHVWYPFVLCGGILVVVTLSAVPAIRKGYEQAELRKMQALDV